MTTKRIINPYILDGIRDINNVLELWDTILTLDEFKRVLRSLLFCCARTIVTIDQEEEDIIR